MIKTVFITQSQAVMKEAGNAITGNYIIRGSFFFSFSMLSSFGQIGLELLDFIYTVANQELHSLYFFTPGLYVTKNIVIEYISAF